MQRLSRHVLLAALALAGITTVPAGAGRPAPVHVFATVDSAASELSLDLQDDCGAPSATPVPDGQPIVVRLPPAKDFVVGQIPSSAWRHPWVRDPAWRLHFEGFMYLPALAARAAKDGSVSSLLTMTGQVAAFHDQNPDPGTSSYGWDEGTAQRRLQVENCLYAVTRDPRLIAGMQADAAVLLGPRYYGPPNYPVHNHGLMANLRLVRGGELLVRNDWVTTALQRMQAESPLAFSPLGTSWEQSSQYDGFNVALWSAAADQLAQRPTYQQAANEIKANLAKAAAVYLRMAEPDGRIVQIGDSDRLAGDSGSPPVGIFRDDAAGYVLVREKAAATSTYYTLRYGPPLRAHGHLDRGGVTWTSLAARVLVGVGHYGTSPSAAFASWTIGTAGANVAMLQHGGFRGTAPVTVVTSAVHKGAQTWLLDDRQYAVRHLRDVNVSDVAHSMTVADSFSGRTDFVQVWHLDPSWQLVSHRPAALTFRGPDGRVLTVTTNGTVAALLRGSMSPVGGWVSLDQRTRTPAYEIVIRATSPTLRSTFRVR